MLDLAFRPDRAHPEPVYRQLADYLRGLVIAGRIGVGQKLPATRELAQALGLSRNTVNLAYDALAADRVVTAHVGQGTFVAPQRPRARAAHGAADADTEDPRASRLAWEGLFARAAKIPVPAIDPAPANLRFDFRAGRVDVGALPKADLRRAFAHALDTALPALANRLDPQGWPPLREEIARSLVARGIACRAEHVLIVQGAQEGLNLLARLLLEPGDTAVMEEPGWFGARMAFAAREANLVPVPVDAGGIRTDLLARVLRSRRAKLVYVTPAVQSPTGVALAEPRRAELLALAEEHQCAIVEDDFDSELRIGSAQPALARDDAGGRVAYLGTFSKALFPALRVGYLVAAPPVIWRGMAALGAGHFGGGLVAQAALAELLRTGAVDRHVRRTRRLYAERLEALLAALAEHLPEGTRAIRPAGGSAVWVELPETVDVDALARAAHAEGIALSRGTACFLGEGGRQHLTLSFASEAKETISEGIALLGRLAHRSPRAHGGIA
jgi:GntR family transcriptional regulator / MocR family aminotransferase